METNRISFLNTYIDNLTAQEAKKVVETLVEKDGTRYVVTPNADIIVKMQSDLELKKACDQADLVLTDGQILVKLSKYLGIPIKERVCMTDFVWDVLDLSVEKGYRVFLLGGKEDSLTKAVANIKERYPDLNMAGYYSPPLGFEQDAVQIVNMNERIRKSEADILLVFLGCPKQEMFIYKNREKYQASVSIPMGGCVDFIAGNVRRAPVWMQKAGFEWFFRFLQEPRRMFRRYFVDDMKIFGLAWKYKRGA